MKKKTRKTQDGVAYCQYFAGGTSSVQDGSPSSRTVACSSSPTRALGPGCSGAPGAAPFSGSDGGRAGGSASAGAGSGSGKGAAGGTITTEPVFGPAPWSVSSAGASRSGEAGELGGNDVTGAPGFFPATAAADVAAPGTGGLGLVLGRGAWASSALTGDGSSRVTFKGE